MRQVLIKLQDNEVAAKINLTTGEIIEMKSDRREYFSESTIFRKSDSNSWTFLFRELSYEEFLAAEALTKLDRLNDRIVLRHLIKQLSLSSGEAKLILETLFDYGVYARLGVMKPGQPYLNWIINPYLSFGGQLIDSSVAELFNGTHVEKAFRDKDYIYNPKNKI